MTIGIDASRALRSVKTGTEWYSVEIIRHLTSLDTKNQYILYSHKPAEAPLLDLPKNVTWKIMPFPRGWTLFRLSYEMMRHAPDVLFIPAHTLPLIAPKRSVVMVHDLGFKHYPELYPWRQKAYHNFVVDYVARHATHILTPSEFTKKDLIKFLQIPENKITVVYHGYDDNLYQPRHNSEHQSAQYQPYIFFIGRLETKKNITGLIEAFKILRTQNPKLTPKLVLAGKPSHGYEQIKILIDSLGDLKKDIVELGYVPEAEMPTWYSNAAMLAFPTFFEGFGFPIIQAMACGTPVVTSNTTANPEIAGKAALLVDPYQPHQIAENMAKIFTNASLKADLINKGFDQVKKFSWTNATQKTLEVIEKISKS